MRKVFLTLFLTLFLIGNCLAAETVTQSQLTSDATNTLGWTGGDNGFGQGFKVSVADPVTRFTMKLRDDTDGQAGTGTLTGYIYSDNGSGIPNAALATFSTQSVETLTGTFADYDFIGSYTPVVGTQYHIVLIWTGGTNGNQVTQGVTTPSAYADGILSYRNGTTWNGVSTYDAYFKVWQTPAPPAAAPSNQAIWIN